MKARTRDEQREYMRRYRAEKKAAQQMSKSLAEGATAGVTAHMVDIQLDEVDTSTNPTSRMLDAMILATAASRMSSAQRIAAGLAAPDDDCGACGHDRQSYHLTVSGKCQAPLGTGRAQFCGCPAFVDPAEPF